MTQVKTDHYTNSALRIGQVDNYPDRVAGEFISKVVSNDSVNGEYKLIVVEVHEAALRAYAGQMFHLLCPSPDSSEVWMRRPMSIYRINRDAHQLEFLYKVEGRGTRGIATLNAGDEIRLQWCHSCDAANITEHSALRLPPCRACGAALRDTVIMRPDH
jgi:dihydroorotate dehydrogenase electron transfer subunit